MFIWLTIWDKILEIFKLLELDEMNTDVCLPTGWPSMLMTVVRVCFARSNTLPLTIYDLCSIIGKLWEVDIILQICDIWLIKNYAFTILYKSHNANIEMLTCIEWRNTEYAKQRLVKCLELTEDTYLWSQVSEMWVHLTARLNC